MVEATTPEFQKVDSYAQSVTVINGVCLWGNYPRDFLDYIVFGQKVKFL